MCLSSGDWHTRGDVKNSFWEVALRQGAHRLCFVLLPISLTEDATCFAYAAIMRQEALKH